MRRVFAVLTIAAGLLLLGSPAHAGPTVCVDDPDPSKPPICIVI